MKLENLPTGVYIANLAVAWYISYNKHYYDLYEFHSSKNYRISTSEIKPKVLSEDLKTIRVIKNDNEIEFDDKLHLLSLESQTIYNIVKNCTTVNILPEYYTNIINKIRIIMYNYHKFFLEDICNGDCKDFMNGTSCNQCVNTPSCEELRYLGDYMYNHEFPDIKTFYSDIYFYYEYRKQPIESLTDINLMRICNQVRYNLIIEKSRC